MFNALRVGDKFSNEQQIFEIIFQGSITVSVNVVDQLLPVGVFFEGQRISYHNQESSGSSNGDVEPDEIIF